MKLNVIIAAVFATVGFVLSLIAGISADNAFESIILKALLSCVVCYVVGYLVGAIAQVITQEHAVDVAKKVAVHDAKIAEEKEAAARVEAQALAEENTPASANV